MLNKVNHKNKNTRMLKKKQIKNKYSVVGKRTYDATLAIVPTSILINQTLARLKFSYEKKLKPVFCLKEAYKFR